MLTIVTMTGNMRPAWLAQCVSSIRAQEVAGAVHSVIHCPSLDGWSAMRLGSIAVDTEFVAFVDDDDVVMSGSLGLCCQALRETGAGVAFTREAVLYADGSMGGTHSKTPPATLADVARFPHAIHHLAVMRTSSIDAHQVAAAHRGLEDTGAGLDWLIKANAAAHGGAVHVPMIGYGWRRHREQLHSVPTRMQALHGSIARLRADMAAWFNGRHDQAIPIWQPNRPDTRAF
jgi:hypothetical protein